MLAFVAPLLAFLTVPNGEGDEFAAMRAAAEAGLPSTAAGPQRESRSSSICSDTPGWTNPHGFGCSVYDVYWCADGQARPGQAWTLGKVFNFPEANCCACGKVWLDEIYLQRLTPTFQQAIAQGRRITCTAAGGTWDGSQAPPCISGIEAAREAGVAVACNRRCDPLVCP